ncbi:MAG TPA: DUF1015 family protein [Gammaproteobacteria bacterium]
MALVKPFRALRASAEHAAGVVAPPYDVVDTDEARALAAGKPDSFLHVSRPEIDLPPGTDPHDAAVYARGAANLRRLERSGALVRDTEASFYVYRMTADGHVQTGIACVASIRAYEENRVKKHELTRPDKETDRVRHIDALNAQTGPVLCAYRADERLEALLDEAARKSPLLDVEGPNAVRHTVWRVAESAAAERLAAALGALDALYIADGHHRSAAASRVARERRAKGGGEDASHEYFLTVAFPHDEMRILDYNRAVAGLNGLTPADLLERLERTFAVERLSARAKPERAGTFGMYLDGAWYRLALPDSVLPSDPVARLDVSLLQEHVIGPLLGVDDPRSDPRMMFVGGVRGLAELERLVDGGRAAVAFAMYPTSMEQLMAVADAERLMPPKSTWFEPKLADGLLSHVLD